MPSLNYDIERFLRKENGSHSPFPGLMYCFSIIDLLGAYIKGQAIGGHTTNNSKKQSHFIYEYPVDIIEVIWGKFYRYEITHLSIHQTAVKIPTDKIISCNLHDEDPNNHLKLK